jgi:hypothetical protein
MLWIRRAHFLVQKSYYNVQYLQVPPVFGKFIEASMYECISIIKSPIFCSYEDVASAKLVN